MTSSTPPASSTSGPLMTSEIRQQPEVLGGLMEHELAHIGRIASEITARNPRLVQFTGRGTSDNAALYGKYLCEVVAQLPAGLTSMSTTTLYGARPSLRGVLVITISQSGGSQDLVDSTRAARACGAITLAVTNAPDSPLAAESEFHLHVRAGSEKATPATKTYTAELLALYLLFDALTGGDGATARAVPDLVTDVLDRWDEAAALAAPYRFADRLVLTARGYSLATAQEAALKIMETSYLGAQAFSAADLLHGPLAMIDTRLPALAVAAEGVGGDAVLPVINRLRERGGDVCAIGSPAAVAAADRGFVLPAVPDVLSPVVEIVPLQIMAHALATGRRFDPDAPRGLSKVTITR